MKRQKKTGKKLSVKEQMKERISAFLFQSASLSEFKLKLAENGLLYYERGKTVGVSDADNNKKYRLKTLGLDEMFKNAQIRWGRFIRRTTGENKEVGRGRSKKLEIGFEI